ncbi:sialate O-acetylesterase [Pedobacter aquae]|uniref:Sialate O-acetylesterase n=1 Tax=Pedobacter aquae TaxID=2605747 RepID=A0A5C0VEZ7_9SPHI|nr:sialate O-acetylesterase [Pedobacter aquae]QEK50423.1 sialate O-acetylesterase [Pedobacter aquae]
MQFKIISIIFLSVLLITKAFAQDKNFHIYLCFGQSNMEGHAKFEAQDTVNVNERFKVMETINCPNLNRTIGNWYTAKPPLTRCHTGLSPADYFGRTLVANLPKNVKVGIINVSVGGCKIELFNKDNFESYVSTSPNWLQNMVKEYDGNPYQKLVDMAKIAQKSGVIKGILMHQGESNTGDTLWTKKVKLVYNNLLKDLKLEESTTPLLAGELVSAEQGGACASMNPIINTLPQTIKNAHIISSKDCEAVSDHLHFSAAGYRKLGARYAEKMLSLQGIRLQVE